MMFIQIEKMADLFSIQLRTGCHCNLGACQMHLGLSEQKMRENFEVLTISPTVFTKVNSFLTSDGQSVRR